ncbi:MAG: FimB/Mfa2 family fimbrial subunit [Porphyromonas endodontalis]|uniref:FimB/Mfa2 family fimbrial subunit n=1 Tax=Porphyromonas endodontalis TaxID=28124 RepID=UPI00361078EB
MKQTPFYYTLWRLLALSIMSLLTLATLSLTSCHDKDTEHDDYGLSAALSWADSADAGHEIKNVRIWIFQAGGKLVAKRQYGSKFPVALDIHPLPVGEYDVVATTNLIEPFGAEGDETFSSLLLKLREASTSAEHAHYAVGHISLPRDRNSRIGLSLRRILSELTVEVEGAPRGTKLETMVLNAADALVPSQKGAEGIWGRASNNKQPAQGKTAIEQNGLIKTETLRPMPTVSHDAYAYLRFTFRLTDGSLRECAAEAPIMKPAGKYTLKMKYSELKPFMHIKPTRISDWEEGWTVVGEILNPDD